MFGFVAQITFPGRNNVSVTIQTAMAIHSRTAPRGILYYQLGRDQRVCLAARIRAIDIAQVNLDQRRDDDDNQPIKAVHICLHMLRGTLVEDA